MGIKLPTQGVGWESLIVIKQEARFKPLPLPKMYSLAGTIKSRHLKKEKVEAVQDGVTIVCTCVSNR
jgi:hypothetical protein